MLTDFKPLKKVTLSGVGDLRCTGLTLIVGPNSSGKTQLLRDVGLRLNGVPRPLVVAQAIELDPLDVDDLIKALVGAGYFAEPQAYQPNVQLRLRTTFWGTGEGFQTDTTIGQARGWHSEYLEKDEFQFSAAGDQFLARFGKILVSQLFLARRLVSLNTVSTQDLLQQPVQNELEALHLDDEAQEVLTSVCLTAFKKGVWLDATRGDRLQILVGDQGLPAYKDRISPTKLAKHRPIEEEGDGLKSFVTMATALILQKRPVCLIDEPEMCLHPPQARALGRLIGKYGSIPDTATFVATHSSEILRGALETGRDVQIVRLINGLEGFSSNLLQADELISAFGKPPERSESILDGIFAQSVIVVEVEGDRLVYQAVWQSFDDEIVQDVHFAQVGGTGGIASTLRLYKALSIPVGVIADIDLLTDLDKFRQVLERMAPQERIEEIVGLAQAIAQRLRELPPVITEESVREKLSQVLNKDFDWDQGGDMKMRGELERVSREIARSRNLKNVDSTGLPCDLRHDIEQCLKSLKEYGIFLVPMGELEDWLPGQELGTRTHKAEFAVATAAWIQEQGRQQDPLWDFVRYIAEYFSQIIG
jgi:hypothetical protein